ncbi:MAG: carboxymuconolactone decarboxylase family protein [Schwartzia sp.]|nr:carboxymuconolactone decarboxylase family protein [Schwartzia sp. (in: firmicutes)]
MPKKIVQTAGRDALGDFAPDFARYNDDILFGEVWSRNDVLSLHDRSLITISALVASGVIDSSLKYHIMTAKTNGVTKDEMVEAITQLGFYAGWPKAWAAFRMAREVYEAE